MADTRVDKVISWIKNNKVTSIFIFLGIAVIAFSTLVASVKDLRENLFGKNGFFSPSDKDNVHIDNDKYKNDNRTIDEIFKDNPIYLKLNFENFELKGAEPNWQYSFLNDRLRFKAGKNIKVGKYITGAVFKNGQPNEKYTQEKMGTLVDTRGVYFGWIEKPEKWGGYSGEYRLTRQEISEDWETDPVTGSKVKYGTVFFEGYVNNDFILDNTTMLFSVFQQNDDWTIVKLEKKYPSK